MKKKKTFYNYIPALIVGAIEGIIITLAITSFLEAKGMGQEALLRTSSCIVIFTAFLLGLGGYYTRKEAIGDEGPSAKLQRIYQSLDIEEQLLQAMIRDSVKENDEWESAWQQAENATGQLLPLQYGWSIFAGFLGTALLVIWNHYLLGFPDIQALLLPLLLLAFLGFQKYRLAGKNPWNGLLFIGLAGAAAAIGAYYAGGFFM